jgi:ligand-binding sensor domain-containing protein
MLWIGTGKGVFMYDPYKEVFTRLKLPRRYIPTAFVDSENNVWFLANSSLYKYDQGKKKLD